MKRICHCCKRELIRDKDTIFRMLMTEPDEQFDIATSYTLYFCEQCFTDVAGENYIDKIKKHGIKR
jgi:hypothetical protein